MAALSDPRAFLSAQEKRAKQLQDLGIDEMDIKDVLANAGAATSAGGAGAAKKGSKTKKEEEKKGKALLLVSAFWKFVVLIYF